MAEGRVEGVRQAGKPAALRVQKRAPRTELAEVKHLNVIFVQFILMQRTFGSKLVLLDLVTTCPTRKNIERQTALCRHFNKEDTVVVRIVVPTRLTMNGRRWIAHEPASKWCLLLHRLRVKTWNEL